MTEHAVTPTTLLGGIKTPETASEARELSIPPFMREEDVRRIVGEEIARIMMVLDEGGSGAALEAARRAAGSD